MPEASLSASLGSLLAATVAFAIGTSVVLRDRRREQFVLFGVFCFNLGLYHLARFFFGFSGLGLFGWFAQTISLLLPWSADRSLSSFVPAVGRRRGGRIQASIGFALLGAQVVALVLPDLARSQWWAQVVPLVMGAYVIGGLLYAATRMWRAARAAAGTAAAPRLKYLFYASLAALALGSPAIPGIGPIVTAVYLYFVAQTLVRERLLDLPEVAVRIISMAALIGLLTGLYALLLLWIPARAGGSASLFLFNAAVASFAVLVVMEPARTEIESRIEGWLFRDRPVLRSILLQLRQKLTGVIDIDEMAKLVMEELKASGRVTRAGLYILDRQGTSLVLRGNLGPVVLTRLDLATQRPLLDRMVRRGTQLRDVLQRERDLARERSRTENVAELQDALETLAALKASLALPLIGRRDEPSGEPDLLGALFVEDERLLEPFAREEIVLFEGVVAQAATTLQNSAVYEARKERDRLAALGEMAAGLAHEIRNPLGAIKGAVQVMEPAFFKLDDNTREFLGVIVEEVDRLNRVVSQFLTYSRPFKGEMAPVDLEEVVGATLRLLSDEDRARIDDQTSGQTSGGNGEADVLPMIRGDADALRQVVHNLLLNALDAIRGMEPAGTIAIRVELRRRSHLRGDAVALSVRDNGPGLSTQTMSNLFVPFHTTKTGGTGLGLPISQRIVENHHGVIEVHSPPEGGAQFTVLLPAATPSLPRADTEPTADLDSDPDPDPELADPAATGDDEPRPAADGQASPAQPPVLPAASSSH